MDTRRIAGRVATNLPYITALLLVHETAKYMSQRSQTHALEGSSWTPSLVSESCQDDNGTVMCIRAKYTDAPPCQQRCVLLRQSDQLSSFSPSSTRIHGRP